MKKILLILSGVFIFAVVNIVPLHMFFANIKGHSAYTNGYNTEASAFFLLAKNIYNVANSYYKMGEYEVAIEFYELEENKTHEIFHNIGNAYYLLSVEEKTSLSKKINLLKKSLTSYKKAEAIQIDEDTTINKKIVEDEIKRLEEALKKADEEEKQEQEEQGQNQQDQNSSSENSENSDEGKEQEDGAQNAQSSEDEEENTNEAEDSENSQGEGDDQSEEQKSGEENKDSQGSGEEGDQESSNQEESKDNQGGLKQEQREAIENYKANLEKSQQEYSEHYNKNYRENRSGFESFFGNDPFFDNSLLDDGEQKKDW